LLACFVLFSSVKDSSVVTVQIFDQKKFKRKDQGFLGVINIRVSSALDLDLGGEGMLASFHNPFSQQTALAD
jgi:hypothetical protein